MLLESLSSPARSESPADVTFLQAIAPKYSALAEKYALADCLAAVHIFVMNPESIEELVTLNFDYELIYE